MQFVLTGLKKGKFERLSRDPLFHLCAGSGIRKEYLAIALCRCLGRLIERALLICIDNNLIAASTSAFLIGTVYDTCILFVHHADR